MVERSDVADGAEMSISRRKANAWFLLIWLIWVVDLMDKMAINAVLPQLKLEFGFSDTELGIVSSIVSLAIGLLALPVAMLVDKWSRRKMIALMVGAWSVATFLTGRATGFQSMLWARSAVGVGEAGYHPAAIALISAWYPKRFRGLAMGVLYTAAPLGSVAGVVAAGVLSHSIGWRACFGILAVPGLVLALLGWFLPDYKSAQRPASEARRGGSATWENVLYIVHSPALICLYLACAASALANLGFATWGVTFFVRVYEMNPKNASLLIGAVTLIATPGAVLGGWLGDRLTRFTVKGRLLATMACSTVFFVLMSAALQLAASGASLSSVAILWTLASFFLLGIVSNQFSAVQDLAAGRFRATAAGFVPLFQQAIGGFLGPVLAGAISDRMGLGASLQAISAISAGLVVLLSLLAIRWYDQGLARVQRLESEASLAARPT